MGDRSNSGGVRNIRAMFEARVENTSPPSRGRSPANSELSGTGSRPISTVRTSFVAVDRSGQLGPLLGVRKSSDAQSTGARSSSVVSDTRLDDSAVVETPRPLAHVKEEEGSTYFRGREGTYARSTNNVKMSGTTGKDGPADLGTLLKGSPFESGSPKKTGTSGTSGTDVPKKVDAGPGKLSSVKAAAKLFNDNASPARSDTSKPAPPKPASISTKAATSSKVGPGPQSAKSDKAAKTPTTPKAQISGKPSQSPKAVKSPKAPVGAKEAGKVPAPAKAPVRKTSRLSLAQNDKGKSSAAAAPATASAKPAPKPSAPSKKADGNFVKPAPKSPTKPVKLPAAAVATTTAASAKLGGGSRSPSRTSNVGPNRRSSAVTNTSRQSGVGVKPKASRASLAPSGSNGRPASRTSTATKKVSEGFLERMMRPTQSSANKTHEKTEVKSPPRGDRASAPPKPKREHEVTGTGKDKKGTAKSEAVKDEDESKVQNTKILEPKFESPVKVNPEPLVETTLNDTKEIGSTAIDNNGDGNLNNTAEQYNKDVEEPVAGSTTQSDSVENNSKASDGNEVVSNEAAIAVPEQANA